MATLSRRRLAHYAAQQIAAGDKASSVMKEIGAYLVDRRRTREAELLVRDIENALLKNGIVLATAISARALSTEAVSAIEAMVKAEYSNVKRVVLREDIDASVIGGVKLVLPDKQLDSTIKARLEKLKV